MQWGLRSRLLGCNIGASGTVQLKSAFLTARHDSFNQWEWRRDRNGFCDFCCVGTRTLPLRRTASLQSWSRWSSRIWKKTPIKSTKLTKIEKKISSSIFATGIGPTVHSDIKWRKFEIWPSSSISHGKFVSSAARWRPKAPAARPQYAAAVRKEMIRATRHLDQQQ